MYFTDKKWLIGPNASKCMQAFIHFECVQTVEEYVRLIEGHHQLYLYFIFTPEEERVDLGL